MAKKILLIEDDLEHSNQLKSVLNKLEEKPLVEIMGNLWTSISRLAKGGVDLIILDLDLPDSQGYETYTRLRQRANTIPIMLLVELRDEGLGERLIKDGASCYLVKGYFDETRFINTVLALLENPDAKPQEKPSTSTVPKEENENSAKVLSFIGAKGGVGTTTVALNCALALALQKKNVIAVELHPSYGTFSQQLNQSPNETIRDLLHLDPKEITMRDINMKLYNSPLGIRVLFGPQKVSDFKPIGEDHALAIIKILGQLADYMIIDLPSYPTLASCVVTKHCSFVGLVVEKEPGSVISARVTKELLKSWGVSGGILGSIIVNKTSYSNPMKLPDIRSNIGCEIMGVVPPAPEACLMALQMGAPLIISQSETLAATTFIEITSRISQDKVIAMKI